MRASCGIGVSVAWLARQSLGRSAVRTIQKLRPHEAVLRQCERPLSHSRRKRVFACARKVVRPWQTCTARRSSEFAPLHRQLQNSRGKRKIYTVGRAQSHITRVQFHVLSNAHFRDDSIGLFDRMLGPGAETRILARHTDIKVKVLRPRPQDADFVRGTQGSTFAFDPSSQAGQKNHSHSSAQGRHDANDQPAHDRPL